jgi:predicted nucleic acid-binding protein
VLARLGVRRNVIGALINRLREEAEVIEVRRSVQLSPDPGDDPFCNCAEEGKADFIVTLNPKDFPKTRLTAKVIIPGDPIPTTAGHRSRSR